jgi:class 3 adenylate cyclase
MSGTEPVHRALFAVDVESSGGRDNQSSVVIREVLFDALRNAFAASSIEWGGCTREDTGDGMMVLVPPEFPKPRLVYPLLDQLGALLRQHNYYAGPATRIRVRVAMHAGDVRIDKFGGVTGRPKVLTARLLDSEPVKSALARAPESTTVMLIVSDLFYEDVVRQGNLGIDPDQFGPVTVKVKETEERAWLRAGPGQPGPAMRAASEPVPAAAEPVAPTMGVNFSGSSVRIGGDVVGGNKIVHHGNKGVPGDHGA